MREFVFLLGDRHGALWGGVCSLAICPSLVNDVRLWISLIVYFEDLLFLALITINRHIFNNRYLFYIASFLLRSVHHLDFHQH